MSEFKYVHDEIHHNLEAPTIIVSYLMEKINPKSVIDIGCGIGTFLKVFKEYGVDDILGIDGEWVNLELLKKYINPSCFKTANIENEIILNRKYDLAICLEVAEHLKEDSADTIVKSLTKLSDIIIFSAAFPGQGGQNHINEQWPTYWEEKFSKNEFQFYDVLRPVFWDNSLIPVWYKQNIFLVVKNGSDHIVDKFKENLNYKITNIVHPEYFNIHLNNTEKLEILQKQYNDVLKGRNSIRIYVKIISKFFLRKIHLYNK
jgi:trans-aconitate methyltransferase